MRIAVTPLKMDEKTNCSLACAMMILDYYGCELSRGEVERSIHRQLGNIYLVEVARLLRAQGLRVNCISYNLYYTDPNDANLQDEELIKTLETELRVVLDDWYKSRLEATIAAIKEGVNYRIQKPTKQVIASYLTRGIPLIASTSTCALMNRQGDPYEGHTVVLSGLNNDNLFYIDPGDGIEKQIDFDDFMFAMLSRKITATSAYIVAAEAKDTNDT